MEIQDRMIMSMIQGFSTSYLLYTACELGIFDCLYGGGMTLSKLSNELDTEEEVLYRLLRPLAAFNLVKEDKGVFYLASLGVKLSKHPEGSLKGLVLFCGRESMRCWSKMYEAVKLHSFPYMLVEGKPFFDAQQDDNAKFSDFNSVMRNSSKNLELSPYFEQQTNKGEALVIVDIGGGAGDIVSKFLGFYQNAGGIIFDLEHVKSEAQKNLESYSVNKRCEFKTGNFFREIDVKGDLFILSRILHDWEDEKACEILKNVRKAMPENSALLVIEKILPNTIEKDCLHLYMNDLYIWSVCGGKERTEEEFLNIFGKSGLMLEKKYKLTSDEYVLEVKKKHFEEGIL